jgi:hypothetical protein
MHELYPEGIPQVPDEGFYLKWNFYTD